MATYTKTSEGGVDTYAATIYGGQLTITKDAGGKLSAEFVHNDDEKNPSRSTVSAHDLGADDIAAAQAAIEARLKDALTVNKYKFPVEQTAGTTNTAAPEASVQVGEKPGA